MKRAMDVVELRDASGRSVPWYRNGLRFECTRCGKCCSGPNGYVWVGRAEIERIAGRLGLPLDVFGRKYLRRVGLRYALLDQPGERSCVFLDGSQCAIHEVRPDQCRRFPWWPDNLRSPAAWRAAADDCEGIHAAAPLVPAEQIESTLRSSSGADDSGGSPSSPGAPPRRAGKLRTLYVLLATTAATLRITIATLFDTYRGTFRREDGDRRLRWWSRRLLELAEVRCEVHNPHGTVIPSERPVIIMSNHGSLYDIPLIFVSMPGSIRMLTKKELFRVPLWGRGMRAGEFVSIDRHDRAQAIRDLEAAREKMSDGIVLWVAPEGTRAADGRLGPFKKGGFMVALQTGATIIPVGIRGASSILPPRTFMALELGRTAQVHIGEPIDAARYSVETRDALMALVEARVRDLADL